MACMVAVIWILLGNTFVFTLAFLIFYCFCKLLGKYILTLNFDIKQQSYEINEQVLDCW